MTGFATPIHIKNGFLQGFQLGETRLTSGHTYPASAAKCSNGELSSIANYPLRIICATSIPSNVAEADAKDLKPRIGFVIFLMNR